MRRIIPLLVLALLGACAKPAPKPEAVVIPVVPIAVGEVGPDGGRVVVADRGIGGTGIGAGVAPVTLATTSLTTDLGPHAAPLEKTGIIGVLTGFGSIFVDGLEIPCDDSIAIDLDGSPVTVSMLRAGQIVAIRTLGPTGDLHARMISIRSEVIGPIERMDPGSRRMTVAGQPVSVADNTWGANRFRMGDWVKVSGLRHPDGAILASRLDAAPIGHFIAHGQVMRDGAAGRVGNLTIEQPLAATLKDAQFVTVSGTYADGIHHVRTVAPDDMAATPAEYFGASTNRLVVQGFVHIDKESLSVDGMKFNTESIAPGVAGSDGIAIVSMKRGADGAYVASGLRYAGYRGPSDQVSSDRVSSNQVSSADAH